MITNEELRIIYRLFRDHLKSIGIVSIVARTRGFKRYYTTFFFILSAFLVCFLNYPLWIFILPIIPLIIFWILYIVDLNIMIQCLVKIQKILIEENAIILDLNQLLDILQDYAKENDFFKVS